MAGEGWDFHPSQILSKSGLHSLVSVEFGESLVLHPTSSSEEEVHPLPTGVVSEGNFSTTQWQRGHPPTRGVSEVTRYTKRHSYCYPSPPPR